MQKGIILWADKIKQRGWIYEKIWLFGISGSGLTTSCLKVKFICIRNETTAESRPFIIKKAKKTKYKDRIIYSPFHAFTDIVLSSLSCSAFGTFEKKFSPVAFSTASTEAIKKRSLTSIKLPWNKTRCLFFHIPSCARHMLFGLRILLFTQRHTSGTNE